MERQTSHFKAYPASLLDYIFATTDQLGVSIRARRYQELQPKETIQII